MIRASIGSNDRSKKSQCLENRCILNFMLREHQGSMSLCGSMEECQKHFKEGNKKCRSKSLEQNDKKLKQAMKIHDRLRKQIGNWKARNAIDISHHDKRFSKCVNELFATLASQSSDEKMKLVRSDNCASEDCEIDEKVSVAHDSPKADDINSLHDENEGRECVDDVLEDNSERNVARCENNVANVNESANVSLDDCFILRITFSCICRDNVDFHIVCAASEFKNSPDFLKEDMLANCKNMCHGKLLMSFKDCLHAEWENKSCESD